MDEFAKDVDEGDRSSDSIPFDQHFVDDNLPLENDRHSPPAPQSEQSNIAVEVEVICPRCGKGVSGSQLKCPFCAARLIRPGELPVESRQAALATKPATSTIDLEETTTYITRLLIFYLLLLFTNLIGHWIAFNLFDERLSKRSLVNLDILFTAVFEGIDTLIVLFAFFKLPVERLPGPKGLIRQIGWLASPFILAILLAMNFGYHYLLQDYLQFPDWVRIHLHLPIPWAVLFICIQPGIVEELFFRYVALGTLNRVMGVSAALVVTSVMFGMAHSSVLLSIPILTVVGLGLGLVRIWSGNIVLPMLLHALHNAVVVYFEMRR